MQYELVCFDLDGTLFDDTIFVWQTLHEYFQTDRAKRKDAFEKAMRNEITYEEWFYNDLELLRERGATRDRILDAIAPMKLMSGTLEVLSALKQQGRKLGVISGSLDIAFKRLLPEHDFDYVLINKILFDDQGEIIGGAPTKFDMANKAAGLKMIAARENIPLESCVFVGDNFNDIDVMKAAGLGIAFNCRSEELARVADVVITSKDLREVLKHIK
jgi:phosphoserine phosphatase